jgi:hypothetical protein
MKSGRPEASSSEQPPTKGKPQIGGRVVMFGLLGALLLTVAIIFSLPSRSEPSSSVSSRPSGHPTSVPSTPLPGKAVVKGRVKHGSSPVTGTMVHLCTRFVAARTSCEGEQQSARTDARGDYVFQMSPGTVEAILVDAFSSSQIAWSGKKELAAGNTFEAETAQVISHDLKIYFPERGAVLTDPQPKLEWIRHGGAAYYVVRIERVGGGDPKPIQTKVLPTNLTPSAPLAPATYAWSVTAVDADGKPMADAHGDNDKGYTFTIAAKE